MLNENFAHYDDLQDWNIDDPNEEIEQDDNDDDQIVVPSNPLPKDKREDAIKCFDTCIQLAVKKNY